MEQVLVLVNQAVTTSRSLSGGPFQTANRTAASGGPNTLTHSVFTQPRWTLECEDDSLGNMSVRVGRLL